jgi:hypothetical protein
MHKIAGSIRLPQVEWMYNRKLGLKEYLVNRCDETVENVGVIFMSDGHTHTQTKYQSSENMLFYSSYF